jgi:uncharacterized protein (DUF3084 family)
MSATPILLIIALMIGSGLLAMFGDWYGTKLGKARVSIFGLRPRRTASFVTVVTGIVIAGLSLGLLLAVSEYARKALFEVDDLTHQVTDLTRDKATLTGEIAGVKKDLAAERRHLKEIEDRYEAALERSKSLQASIADKEARIARLNAAQAQQKEQIDNQQRLLAALSEQQAALEEEVKKKTTDLEHLEDQVANIKGVIQREREIADNLYRSLDENEKLRAELQDEIDRLGREKQTVNEEISTLRGELAAARKQLEIISGVREGRLIFLAGEEIERAIIDGSERLDSIRSQVMGALVSASAKAEEIGAKKSENGRFVVLAKSDISPLAPTNASSVSFSEDEIVDAVADQIHAKGQSVVVILIAMMNTLEGETVPVDFELFTNKLVFSAGQTIAATKIDGRLSKGEILAGLEEFLSGPVADSATAAGIIPSRGRYAGAITYEELLDATDTIRAAQRTISVRAKVKEDTWSGDKLRVRLEVP